jgi:hypothetical protein
VPSKQTLPETSDGLSEAKGPLFLDDHFWPRGVSRLARRAINSAVAERAGWSVYTDRENDAAVRALSHDGLREPGLRGFLRSACSALERFVGGKLEKGKPMSTVAGPSSSTERSRRHRQRRRHGTRCITVVANESEIAALAAGGYLAEEARGAPVAIKAAIEVVVAAWHRKQQNIPRHQSSKFEVRLGFDGTAFPEIFTNGDGSRAATSWPMRGRAAFFC